MTFRFVSQLVIRLKVFKVEAVECTALRSIIRLFSDSLPVRQPLPRSTKSSLRLTQQVGEGGLGKDER